MASKLELPNEETMQLKDLDNLQHELNLIYQSKNLSDKSVRTNLNSCLGKLKGYILVADRKNLTDYFGKFYNLNLLDLFIDFLELGIQPISFSIIEMFSFFISNIENKDFLDYLYKTKYPANIPDIPDIKINILDKLINLDPLKDDEFLSIQVNFIKSLTLKKINIDSLHYFYNSDIGLFPILIKSFSLYNHSDPIIRNVVKNIFLSIIKIEDKNLREFLTTFPINLYFTNIIFEFKNTIIKLSLIDFNQNEINENCKMMRKYHDSIYDSCLYLSDLLLLNIEKINYIIINCLLNEIILPSINSIANYQNQENINIYYSLYVLSLILYTIKNEFLYNLITFLLFREKIPKPFLEKITSAKFNKIDDEIMENINILIVKSQDADVNDENWKSISKLMKKTNGIDLSNGELDYENIYDYVQNFMNYKNEYTNNPIFENINFFFLCNDDSILLILNLIINSCISFYKNIKRENNDYNILNNNFFQIDLKDHNSKNIFNRLFNYLNSSKNFRMATNELMLYNIQSFIKLFLENNNNNNEYKKILSKLLLNLIEKQINDMQKKIEKDPSSIKYLFDSGNKAYTYYIKNIEKKISDLSTLSHILIPLIYLDKIQEIPPSLKEDGYIYDYIKNYFFKIIFINDIINDLENNENDIIKNKSIPLVIDTFSLNIGKEYKLEELNDDCYHCKIYKNNNYIKCGIVFSLEMIYFGQIMSDNFNDLSKVKIFKKIPLRYLEMKKTEDSCILNIFDKTNEGTYKNCIKMHGLNPENTVDIYDYCLQQVFNSQLEEKKVFNEFIVKIKKNLDIY